MTLKFNGVPMQTAGPASVDRLFAAQAARYPDRVAILCNDIAVSYAKLDDMAGRLAQALRARGAGRGRYVAMLLPRSVEAIVTMLAVLRTGAAFVPLDPGYAPPQLQAMVDDCAPICVVADLALLAELGDRVAWRAPNLVFEDAIAETCTAPLTADACDACTDPGDPAYVMYTSGSTGLPKGVVVPHRGIVRLVIGTDYVSLGPEEVILQLAPLAFDASTFEIWGSLLNGGRLVILPSTYPTLDEIAAIIARHGVTTMWLTAGLFHAVVDRRLDALRPLRQLLAGGDVLSPAHVAKVLNAVPGCRLINGYGPTENTTFTCCHTIGVADLTGGSIPIGRPISGTRVYIVDADMRPVPDGEEGQLCAGGDGVALGYLNRPDLSAQRFVPDSFRPSPDGLLYLTGDLVRRRADGVVIFLGRIDRQVKINGRRVEFDAIEAVMRRQPGVMDAVAVLREDTPGRKLIIGYVTGTADGVLELLRRELPDWMIPAAVIPLPTMPLTPNGKLDRARLPMPERAPILAPRNDVERRLTAIWQRALRVPVVGRDDNFFDLGGTSLQLIEAHAEIQADLKPDITVIDLFDNPRISDIAALILRQWPARAGLAAIPDRSRQRDDMRRRMRAARST